MKSATEVDGTYAWLIRAVAKKSRLPLTTTKRVLRSFHRTLAKAVWRKGHVFVPGLGAFNVKPRKGRSVVDPTKLTESIALPAHRVVTCRVSKKWRRR